MEKTIEEKRAAVLAYCKEVCKGKYVDVHIPTINVGIEEKDLSYWFWTTDDQGNRAGGLMGTLSTSMHTVLENPFIERMYRLFGLQTRDAVAKENAIAEEYLEMLKTERDQAWATAAAYLEFKKNYEAKMQSLCQEVDAEREKVTELQNSIKNLEKRKNELLDECVHRMRTDSVGTSLYDLIILAHENGVPMITKSNMYLNGDPKQIPVYTWASTTHENPITHLIDLIAQRDAERAKSAKWESRAWKILGIVRNREAEQRPKTANVLKALRECGKKLESECAKSAKLVEALEEIENVPTKMQETIDIYQESEYQLKTDSELIEKIAEFGFGELEFHTADIERLVTQSGIAFNALEAYKKGGVQG